jgi:hypothetical protein
MLFVARGIQRNIYLLYLFIYFLTKGQADTRSTVLNFQAYRKTYSDLNPVLPPSLNLQRYCLRQVLIQHLLTQDGTFSNGFLADPKRLRLSLCDSNMRLPVHLCPSDMFEDYEIATTPTGMRNVSYGMLDLQLTILMKVGTK